MLNWIKDHPLLTSIIISAVVTVYYLSIKFCQFIDLDDDEEY